MGHGNVHWSANFDEIQDFEHDIRGPFGGSGFMSTAAFNAANHPLGAAKTGQSAELDALAAYVSSLNSFDPSPYRNQNGSLTADAVAGKALFDSQGCAACHGGADFSDSDSGLMHDVGTISSTSGNRPQRRPTRHRHPHPPRHMEHRPLPARWLRRYPRRHTHR